MSILLTFGFFGVSPQTPFRKLFEKSFLKTFKNFAGRGIIWIYCSWEALFRFREPRAQFHILYSLIYSISGKTH